MGDAGDQPANGAPPGRVRSRPLLERLQCDRGQEFSFAFVLGVEAAGIRHRSHLVWSREYTALSQLGHSSIQGAVDRDGHFMRGANRAAAGRLVEMTQAANAVLHVK